MVEKFLKKIQKVQKILMKKANEITNFFGQIFNFLPKFFPYA